MEKQLERITDIRQLKPGDKIICIGAKSEVFEFLCIHPHSDSYSLFLDASGDGTAKFYNGKLRDGNYYRYTDSTELLAMRATVGWYREQADFLQSLLDKKKSRRK